jgi:hypothetical protein
MELLMVICSSTLREELHKVMKENNIQYFTQIPEVYGSGKGGGTKLNTDVWPGINMLYYITTSEEQGKILKQWARKYKEAGVREGLKIFSLQMSEII